MAWQSALRARRTAAAPLQALRPGSMHLVPVLNTAKPILLNLWGEMVVAQRLPYIPAALGQVGAAHLGARPANLLPHI